MKGRAGDVHVSPKDPLIDHRIDSDGICWCQPWVHYEDPFSGSRVIVHREPLC